jgi:signal transduction histidine kinase/ActR/RegA family two-component response regulator
LASHSKVRAIDASVETAESPRRDARDCRADASGEAFLRGAGVWKPDTLNEPMTSTHEAQLAAEALPVAIWLGRVPGGEVVYTNAAFREVLGLEAPPDAARGGFVEPYGVHQLDGTPYPEANMPFERVIAARASVVVDDLVIHRRDGRRVNLRVFAKPLFDEAGNITHVLEAFTDITREVAAEAARAEGERRLARGQRLESIGQLVAGIAHDFNNLLTVTKLVVARLIASERHESRRADLADVDAVTDSAIGLIRNLLDFAGRTRTARDPIAVDSVVESVTRLAQRTFERRISLATSLDARGGWIVGDRSQLEQVVMNLLVNARDAIPAAGEITVTTRLASLESDAIDGCPAGDYVLLEVADTGSGIDPAIRDRVFEPYFTTKDLGPVKGTGLGLSTVHGIVRSHSGFIEIARASEHARPRGGTVMRVAFPQARAAAHTARSVSPPSTLRAPDEEALVLIIEDERLVREATSAALRELGYRVLEAETGASGLEAFRRHAAEITVVVLDMVMPDLGAREVYSAMRRERAHIPVLLITASANQDDVQDLIDGGVRGWLAKPFEAAALAAAVRRLAESPKAPRTRTSASEY